MFITINRTNHVGDLKETLINTDFIVSVKERTLDPTNLYDSEGNLVETRPNTEKAYKVILKGGITYVINDIEYATLKATLTK